MKYQLISQELNKYLLENDIPNNKVLESNFTTSFERLNSEIEDIRETYKKDEMIKVAISNEIDIYYNLVYLFDKDKKLFISYYKNKFKNIFIYTDLLAGCDAGSNRLLFEEVKYFKNEDRLWKEYECEGIKSVRFDYESDTIFARKNGKVFPLNDYEEYFFNEAINTYNKLPDRFSYKQSNFTKKYLEHEDLSIVGLIFYRESLSRNEEGIYITPEKIAFMNNTDLLEKNEEYKTGNEFFLFRNIHELVMLCFSLNKFNRLERISIKFDKLIECKTVGELNKFYVDNTNPIVGNRNPTYLVEKITSTDIKKEIVRIKYKDCNLLSNFSTEELAWAITKFNTKVQDNRLVILDLER